MGGEGAQNRDQGEAGVIIRERGDGGSGQGEAEEGWGQAVFPKLASRWAALESEENQEPSSSLLQGFD